MTNDLHSKRRYTIMQCEICGKQSKRLGRHVSTVHKISAKDYYNKYFKQPNEGICPMCSKETPFLGIHIGYQKHCCARCGIDNPETRKNFEQSMLKNYGVKYSSQSKELLNKGKQTRKDRYGDENYNNRDKAKETCLDRYGTDSVTRLDSTKEKIKQTNLKRRGVEYVLQDKEIIQKSKKTKLEKYGSETYNNQEKTKQTCLEKYGKEYFTQTKDYKEKCKQTCVDRYGVEYLFQAKEVREKMNKTYQEKYGADWYVETDEFKEKVKDKVMNGPDSIDTAWRSKAEDIIIDAIKSVYDGEIYSNNKKAIYPKELDIYMPSINLAIEYNGIVYHSNAVNYPINGHLIKSLACREKNIRLIHIYEFEDLNTQIELLKSLIIGQDCYPKNDFNKNNLLETIPEPEIIYKDENYTIYGAGQLIECN